MANEKLTTLARRLRPFFAKQTADLVTSLVQEGPDIDLVTVSGGVQVGRGGDTILLFDSGGLPVAEYAATEAGFNSAIAAATSGDLIRIPNLTLTITTQKIIPVGVTLQGMSREGSIIAYSGTVAIPLDVQGYAENFTVNFTYTGTTVAAVAVYVSGQFSSARKINVTATSTSNTSELEGVLALGEAKIPIEDITADVTGNKYATGIRYVSTGSVGHVEHIVRNLNGRAETTSTSVVTQARGVTVGSNYNDRISIYNCNGMAFTSGSGASFSTGMYIYAVGVTQAFSCYGLGIYNGTSDTGFAAGIEYGSSYRDEYSALTDCVGIGSVDYGSNSTAYGLLSTYDGRVIGGYYEGDSYGDGPCYGGYFWDRDEHLTGATFFAYADNAGVAIDLYTEGTVYVYGCQYATSGGIIRYLHGDRSVNPVTTLTVGTTTVSNIHDCLLCNAVGGAIILNLPAAAGYTDRTFTIKKIDASANTVTINGSGAETIDGVTPQVIAFQWTSITIVCDGTGWYII